MVDINRRDRRAEWIQRNRLHPLHKALSQTGPVRGPTGLIRENPHEGYFIGPNGVKRIDRSGNLNQVANPTGRTRVKADALPELPLHVVAQPEFFIAVVLDLSGGRLTSHDKDVLGQAHKMLSEIGGDGAVLAIGFAQNEGDIKEEHFDSAGVDRLVILTGDAYVAYSPEAKTSALTDIDAQLSPRYWLFPDSMVGGNELGCRFAAKIGERPVTQAWQVNTESSVCRGQSETIDIRRPTPKVVLLASECANPVDETRHEAKAISVDLQVLESTCISDLGPVEVDPNLIPLAEAGFILSAGNGVKNWDQFHEVARLLSATEGASRVVVDDGFMPRDRQVGASGTWVSAQVYVAIGISGAIQHLQGIGQCEKVVAINTDAGCDMVKRADLSLIGDCEEILTALVHLANQSQRAMSDSSKKAKEVGHAA